MSRPKIALAWPTYNRPEQMAEHLAHILPEAKALGVAIYISDDSPGPETQAAVEAADPSFANLHYRRNVPALRHDANLMATLSWPDADYVWLIGDKLRPMPGILERLLALLSGQDLLFVRNRSDDDRTIASASGEEARVLVRDALWHQALTGTTIYKRSVCDRAQAIPVWRNFPQLSLILDQASREGTTVGWFGEPSLFTVDSTRESYWHARAVEVFVTDWAAVVTAFPKVIRPAERTGVIRSHSRRTYLFNASALMELKKTGQFTRASLKQPEFLQAMHLAPWKLLALLALPRPLFDLAKRARAKVR